MTIIIKNQELIADLEELAIGESLRLAYTGGPSFGKVEIITRITPNGYKVETD